MNIEDIKIIAKETGMDFSMYDPPRLKDIGNGMMGFVASGSLTLYGKRLVEFANAIEKKLSDSQHTANGGEE